MRPLRETGLLRLRHIPRHRQAAVEACPGQWDAPKQGHGMMESMTGSPCSYKQSQGSFLAEVGRDRERVAFEKDGRPLVARAWLLGRKCLRLGRRVRNSERRWHMLEAISMAKKKTAITAWLARFCMRVARECGTGLWRKERRAALFLAK